MSGTVRLALAAGEPEIGKTTLASSPAASAARTTPSTTSAASRPPSAPRRGRNTPTTRRRQQRARRRPPLHRHQPHPPRPSARARGERTRVRDTLADAIRRAESLQMPPGQRGQRRSPTARLLSGHPDMRRNPSAGRRPRRTILGHDRRSRCRAQAGVPVPADETTAWDEMRTSRSDLAPQVLRAPARGQRALGSKGDEPWIARPSRPEKCCPTRRVAVRRGRERRDSNRRPPA